MSLTPLRTGNDIQANTTITWSQKFPSNAALADGGYMASWSSLGQDGSNWRVDAQRYAADGSPRELSSALNTFAPNFARVDGE